MALNGNFAEKGYKTYDNKVYTFFSNRKNIQKYIYFPKNSDQVHEVQKYILFAKKYILKMFIEKNIKSTSKSTSKVHQKYIKRTSKST